VLGSTMHRDCAYRIAIPGFLQALHSGGQLKRGTSHRGTKTQSEEIKDYGWASLALPERSFAGRRRAFPELAVHPSPGTSNLPSSDGIAC
jgi:hypothetical protein